MFKFIGGNVNLAVLATVAGSSDKAQSGGQQTVVVSVIATSFN